MCVFDFSPGFKRKIFCIKLQLHTVKPQQSCTYKGNVVVVVFGLFSLFSPISYFATSYSSNDVRTTGKQLSVRLRQKPDSQNAWPTCSGWLNLRRIPQTGKEIHVEDRS